MTRKWRQMLSGLLTGVMLVSSLAGTAGAAEPDSGFAAAQEAKFENVEMEHRAYARWWLAEGSHTDTTLRESIKELYDMGFGGVEILTLDESDYLADSDYAWGSAEWIHDTKVVMKECNQLGMAVSFTSGTNWSTANLTVITPDDEAASQELGYKTIELAGGESFRGALPTPALPSSDVTQLRFVKLIGAELTEPGSHVLKADSMVDLSDLVVQQDNSTWTVDYTAPETGSHILFAFFRYGTGEYYKPAVTGKGYTINYFDQAGMERLIQYWDEHVLVDGMKELILENGNVSMYMDSLELTTKGADSTKNLWCANYLEEFENRTGYDAALYLPILIRTNYGGFGIKPTYTYTIEGQEEICNEIRCDALQVDTELYMDNCLGVLRSWLHENGMTLRAEPSYGKTLEISQPVKELDYVETESFEYYTDLDLLRSLSGAAHLYNMRYSSETGANRWVNYYWNNDYYRQIFYTQFAAGVQKIVTHGYSSEYGPEGRVDWPGYEGMKNIYSERFSKRQPAAVDYPEFWTHVNRLQKVLEAGVPQMDLVILRTDYSHNNGTYTLRYPVRLDNYGNHLHQNQGFYWTDMTLQNEGYTYDYVSPLLLTEEEISSEQGLLNADGVAYQAVMVIQDELPYETAVRLLQWAKDGLPVVFVNNVVEEVGSNKSGFLTGDISTRYKYNTAAGSTTGYHDGMDEKLAQVVAQIKAQPTVRTVESVELADEALKELGVQARAQYLESNAKLLSVMRKDTDASYLYLYHYMYQDEAPFSTQVSVEGEFQPYLLDTWSGDVSRIPEFKVEAGRTIVNVTLEPGEVMVLALEQLDGSVNPIVETKNVERVLDRQGRDVLAVSESGDVFAAYADGSTITANVQVAEDIQLTQWKLTVDSYEPGEKKSRTEYNADTNLTTTEVTYETNHVMLDAGTLEKLVPWQQIAAIGPEVSGVGTYSNTFTLPEDWDNVHDGLEFHADSYCGGTCAVFVNGTAVPVNMDSSDVDITDYVHPGENTIAVRVTSTLRNRQLEQGYAGWNYNPANPVNEVVPDDYGMTGETWLHVYTMLADPAEAVLTGPENAVVGEKLVYTVTVSQVENLATAAVSAALPEEPAAEPADGWYVIASDYAGGVFTAVLGNNSGLTTDAAAELLTLTVPQTEKTGTCSAALQKVVLSAYTEDGECFVPCKLSGKTVETVVDYSLYDVNRDGVVNQLDLTRAQRYYGKDDAVCDVNGDGVVDISDLILILNNYTK